MAVFLSLYSCVHDELISSSDPASKEYHSKSLWKEDEKYIKNVMKVYFENESEIKKVTGTPLWDYATTVGSFDESFLMVPVIEEQKVVSVLKVPRHGTKIYFYYTGSDSDLAFFQGFVFAKLKKAVDSKGSSEVGRITCQRKTISMWMPDNQNNPNGAGHWESNSIIVCKQLEDECVGIIDQFGDCDTSNGGGGGYDYPTGGNPEPEVTQDPCEKLKTQSTNVDYKAKIEALDKPSILSLKKETGFSESKTGVFTELPQAVSTQNSDGMTVTVTSSLKGYIHTHLNDYPTGTFNDEGDPLINQPIRMFSPADVNTLMTMAEMATNGDYSQLYGTMVSSYGNYTIMFTGTASDIKTGFDTEQWRTDYVNYKKDNPYWSFEKLFLNFLKEKMNVQGVELYKIKSNGTVQKKTLNSNNNVQSSDCPQ
jgi:hypothetical protein